MSEIIVSKVQAQIFLLAYQGLNTGKTKDDVYRVVKDLRCVQYDPLNVVGRNAYLVLQARIKNYKAEDLDTCLYEDRHLLDGWDKMMAIYPSEEWAHYRWIRQAHAREAVQVMKHRGTLSALDIVEDVKTVVEKCGPIFSRDIKLGGTKDSKWGHGKDSSVALDYLFHTGEIGVHHKVNAQKSFDLMENLLAPVLLKEADDLASLDDFLMWYVSRRIKSVGMIWNKNGGAWLGHYLSKKKDRSEILKTLEEENILRKVYVEGIKDAFYIHEEDVDLLLRASLTTDTCILAPLDNLMWDRQMLEAIFDFSYRWEVYVPEAKRVYGYYVLPVLMGHRFIARFEPSHYRGGPYLVIKHWWWCPDVDLDPCMKASLVKALKAFCAYLGAEDLTPESYQVIFANKDVEKER